MINLEASQWVQVHRKTVIYPRMVLRIQYNWEEFSVRWKLKAQ